MTIQLTNHYDGSPVIIGAAHLSTARICRNGMTAVECVGSYRTLWVTESPEQIHQMIEEKRNT